MDKKTQTGISPVKLKSASELRMAVTDEASAARERIRALFDEGTFSETGAFAHRISSELGGDGCEFEGVITGFGAVDGRLVFAFVQDPSRMKGALGAVHAKKICELYDLAIRNGAPVIGVFDSAGAFVMEGVEALAGYGKIMKKVSEASGVIPQIAVIAGVCGGAAATIASMFDIVIGAEKTGSLYVNPPFITNNLEKGAELGKISTAAKEGAVQVVSEDDTSALAFVRTLLSYIPQNSADGTAYSSSNDEINRLVGVDSIISADKYSMADVIGAISDDAKFLELGAEFAKSMLTGFVTLNGMVAGVVANQPAVDGGKITADAAKKAACFFNDTATTEIYTWVL